MNVSGVRASSAEVQKAYNAGPDCPRDELLPALLTAVIVLHLTSCSPTRWIRSSRSRSSQGHRVAGNQCPCRR